MQYTTVDALAKSKTCTSQYHPSLARVADKDHVNGCLPTCRQTWLHATELNYEQL